MSDMEAILNEALQQSALLGERALRLAMENSRLKRALAEGKTAEDRVESPRPMPPAGPFTGVARQDDPL